jgi:hypothetical protein
MFSCIGGVAVSLVLALLGCAALGLPAADHTTVAFADACS